MSLPQLPDLPDLESDKKSPPKKKANKKKVKKSEEMKNESVNEKETNNKKKPIIPKTEYDAEGNPILMIPDLDDVELNDEIERFFG